EEQACEVMCRYHSLHSIGTWYAKLGKPAQRTLRKVDDKISLGVALMNAGQQPQAARQFVGAAGQVKKVEQKSQAAFVKGTIDEADNTAAHDIGESLRAGLLALGGVSSPTTSTTTISTTTTSISMTTTTVPTNRLVFVTLERLSGSDIHGLVGADALCG